MEYTSTDPYNLNVDETVDLKVIDFINLAIPGRIASMADTDARPRYG